jgi:hypothetical protein
VPECGELLLETVFYILQVVLNGAIVGSVLTFVLRVLVEVLERITKVWVSFGQFKLDQRSRSAGIFTSANAINHVYGLSYQRMEQLLLRQHLLVHGEAYKCHFRVACCIVEAWVSDRRVRTPNVRGKLP